MKTWHAREQTEVEQLASRQRCPIRCYLPRELRLQRGRSFRIEICPRGPIGPGRMLRIRVDSQ